MPDNRRVQRNGGISNSSSNPSVHNIDEGLRRLRIQTDGKENGAAAYPERPGEPDCIFYLRTGLCGYGSNCRFNHPTHIGQANLYGGELPERAGEPDCVYFLKTGTCKYGLTCKYNHPRDRRGAGPVVLNMVGLPMRQEEKSCPHYLRTGSCKFGVACKFHHPQPVLDGSNIPVSGPVPYASSIVPSSGLTPHVSGIPAWPFPRATTYVSDPLLQSPQTYLPIVLPPSQAIGPTQGWSTYMASLSPVSSTGIFGGSGSIEQMYPMTSVSHLPERPGEPECRYFMSTGNCKYGSDCKYHHPREKIAQLAASSLGPLGLPLRPGQAVCSYYSLYGLCKYGPTCKYDHPLVGYSYNYSVSLPGISILNPSHFPFSGRNSPTLNSPGSSPSKSSKNPGRTGKPASNGNFSTDPKTSGGSPEHVGSPSHSLAAASEPPQSQSD